MTFIADRDFALQAALGNAAGYASVNKFGQALDCDNAVPTDIWDGADGTTSTDIWVPPTTARTHNIVSTSALDDNPLGNGARSVRVYGLTSWGAAEVFEDVLLGGLTPVATGNAYVIIYRMKVLTFGSNKTNGGIITATATTDLTVTAAIQTGEGQTLMAIYGVPSTQTIAIERLNMDVVSKGSTADITGTLLVDEHPDLPTGGYLTKDRWVASGGGGGLARNYKPPKTYAGPCIVKVQGLSDTVNTICSAGFDAYLVDN